MFHVQQGVSGGIGDPGLPGPTGLRGEFGDRVSFLIIIVEGVFLKVFPEPKVKF